MEEVEVSPLWGQPCQLRRATGNPEAMGKSDELELGIRPLRSIDMACSTKKKKKNQQMETRVDSVVQWQS